MRARTEPGPSPERARAASLVALLGALLAFQGGFFPATSAFGVAIYGAVLALGAVAWRLGRGRGRRPKGSRAAGAPARTSAHLGGLAPAAILAGIASLVVLSAVAHGMPVAQGLVEGSPWLLAALASAVCASLGPAERRWLVKAIAWLGVASAVAGVAMLADPSWVGGTVSANRLQFLFQYANAAGAWFACVALLCFQVDDDRLRRCATAPLTALLLTQSMGSFLAFAVVAVACAVAWAVGPRGPKGRFGVEGPCAEASAFAIQGLIAGLAFCCFLSDEGRAVGMVAFLVGAIGFYEAWPRARGTLAARSWGRVALFASLGLAALGALTLAGLMLPRASQALGTLAERMAQAEDAVALLAGSLPLGIGPDQWQHAYPAVQGSDYRSAVVHCSYLQLGLDAGVLAAAALLSLLAFATAKGALGGQRCAWPLLALVALHGALDFDLRYAFFLVLVGILAALAGARPLWHEAMVPT